MLVLDLADNGAVVLLGLIVTTSSGSSDTDLNVKLAKWLCRVNLGQKCNTWPWGDVRAEDLSKEWSHWQFAVQWTSIVFFLYDLHFYFNVIICETLSDNLDCNISNQSMLIPESSIFVFFLLVLDSVLVEVLVLVILIAAFSISILVIDFFDLLPLHLLLIFFLTILLLVLLLLPLCIAGQSV